MLGVSATGFMRVKAVMFYGEHGYLMYKWNLEVEVYIFMSLFVYRLETPA